MKTFVYCLLLVGIMACQKADTDTVAPEYPDWYTLKSPIDHDIQGVWGSYEKTLLISTMSSIFRSTDQGRHWEQVQLSSNGVFGFIQNKDTLFTMTGLANYQALTNPNNFSVDDGKTWQPYRRYNPLFNFPSYPNPFDKRFYVNPVTTSTGTSYQINQVFLDGPTAKTGIFETPGVITSTGRRIDLPQLHQIQSLYLDDQQRLYITASDAVCGRGHSGSAFSYCNSKNGRGVVYISKKPMP